ncbi:helix-turn-helix transcriptional regulator [Gilvimarinus sp. 1_MG-2023]|uniref:helix-turn-helix transcriptional regulator n=1 Tax=Gilvimarinus sp. 1_MG-2023 TaxID=3062638 RepID=UPI0026E2673C|nr:helix-turn-helix transcriptional regulator [Gilvimarinus sp. 1_MG-2023]MDO6748246.1 helix-turn-helix transcriptional regulator [Gilvimarinus sp. 1_MG-2023]
METTQAPPQMDYVPKVAPQDSFLLGLLVQANSHERGWHQFLDAFCKHFNLHSAHIYIAIPSQRTPIFQECAGAQPSEMELAAYLEHYMQHDMAHLAILTAPPHQWIASNLMPNRELVESTPAYTWAHRNNIHYISGATLFRDTEHTCALVHNRSKDHGEYQPEEMKRFEALSPFIENAMKLRLELSGSNDDNVYIRTALNKMRIPVAILNEFSELLAQNQQMEDFLQQQSELKLSGGTHFRLNQEQTNKALQFAIAQSVSETKEMDLTYSTDLVPVGLKNQTQVFIGVDSIMEDREGQSTFRGAMVYVLAPDLISPLSEETLSKMFNLTKAEATVCQRFSQLQSAKEIARQENKSVYTVREQLRSIFEKTGVTNQMQLINLLSALPGS